MRLLYIILSVVIACVLLAGSASARVYKLASLEYPPYGYAENGSPAGCDVEIIQEAFRRMDEQVEFEFVPWKRALAMALHNATDGVFQVLKTPERCEYMVYSDPVRVEAMTLFVRSDSDIEFTGDIKELRGRTFGVINSFSYGPAIDAFINEHRNINIDVTDSVLGNLCKLVKRRFDIFIADDLSTYYTAREAGLLGDIRRLLPPVAYNPIHVSFCRKTGADKLLVRFNKALKSMKDDGTWNSIIDKYRKRFMNDFPGEPFVLDEYYNKKY
ncbi:substrate-binding periplasmic protein [Maridesulfovibrio sp. FT414]|uniref:substrate-binding periplasmic protein n=1 Tax=Maridesulfovibrio sp. FT414 TaxID=2979469 RepID=UPI003D806A9F